MLTIQVTSIRGAPPAAAMVGVFDQSGGTIGRGDDNTLVLPDPERRISRVHLRVTLQGGQYVLSNQGAGLSALINQQEVAPGEQAVLMHADVIELGAYVLRVALALPGVDDLPTVLSTGAQAASAPPPAAPAADPLAMFDPSPRKAPPAGKDPFADLLAPAPPPARQPPPAAGLIPDDFDPFATPPPISTPLQGGGGVGLGDFDFGAGPDVPAQNIDHLFGLRSRGSSDPFGPGHPLGEPISKPNTAQSSDPLAALQAGAVRQTKPMTIQRDDAPALSAAMPMPKIVPGVGAAAPAAPRARTPAPSADPGTAFLSWEHANAAGEVESIQQFEVAPTMPVPAAPPPRSPGAAAAQPVAARAGGPPVDEAAVTEKLLRALLEGTGVGELPRMPSLTPELMRVYGELLRIATEGTLQLLIARALTKREVHAEATMIAARENNPLKFSPSVEVALQHLLAPAGRGFMSPPRALKDAYNDLRSHQVGVMAGMQAALSGVLARFNPAELERRLTQKTVLESVLPMQRKARLWDLFTTLYNDISQEAEEDFHTLFGKAFVTAYEAQIEKLRQESNK
ncbi:MAG TPA: type VI secretion system-associated FHA domain protein TagH [Burkholderiaceae bacterium]|nr:type VI secretion system-associated FHA domain protein TagH [Burkholderiaceae bacterium]